MPNYCSTQYRIEGPKEEILYVTKRMRDVLYGNPKANAFCPKEMRQYYRENAGKNIYDSRPTSGSRNLNYLLKALKIKGGTYSLLATDLMDDDIRRAPNGELVLSFEVTSAWSPDNELFAEMLKRWAPNSRYYYLSEEFGCHVHDTNDVWKRYFPADYAVHTSYYQEGPENFKKIFMLPTMYRCVINQEGYHSYWSADDMREILAEFVPTKGKLIPDIIKSFKEWARANDVRISIHKIRRIEE